MMVGGIMGAFLWATTGLISPFFSAFVHVDVGVCVEAEYGVAVVYHRLGDEGVEVEGDDYGGGWPHEASDGLEEGPLGLGGVLGYHGAVEGEEDAVHLPGLPDAV